MKYIILVLLIYFAYRLFSGKPLLGTRRQSFIQDQEPDDGYTDYEEVD